MVQPLLIRAVLQLAKAAAMCMHVMISGCITMHDLRLHVHVIPSVTNVLMTLMPIDIATYVQS